MAVHQQFLQVSSPATDPRLSASADIRGRRGIRSSGGAPFLASRSPGMAGRCQVGSNGPSARRGLDYAELRSCTPIRTMLDRIAYTPLRICGDQWRGGCPLPSHPRPKPGETCFSVNLQLSCYNCFRCGSAGDQIKFWAALKQLDLYEAGLDLCHEFQLPELLSSSGTCNPKTPFHPATPPATRGS